MHTEEDHFSSYTTLGVRVHCVQIPDVVRTLEKWIRRRNRCHYVAVTGMHGIVEAQDNPSFLRALNDADLVVPDGMPLVWLARRNGFALERRVYGPELMETFLRQTGDRYRHFLYGGAPGVAEKLAERMRSEFANNVVGTLTPPFRKLSEEEMRSIAATINSNSPDVVWVGLSTPKQEDWMSLMCQDLYAPAVLGVGAAFDFLSGSKSSAPRWIQEHGLEWLFRLLSEPRRLWRRYLLGGTRFVFLVLKEQLSR